MTSKEMVASVLNRVRRRKEASIAMLLKDKSADLFGVIATVDNPEHGRVVVVLDDEGLKTAKANFKYLGLNLAAWVRNLILKKNNPAAESVVRAQVGDQIGVMILGNRRDNAGKDCEYLKGIIEIVHGIDLHEQHKAEQEQEQPLQ